MTVNEILSDPCASNWLKDAVRAALKRDPVDAVNDAEALVEVLSDRLDAVVKRNAPRCADCGELGELTGHMGCQYPGGAS